MTNVVKAAQEEFAKHFVVSIEETPAPPSYRNEIAKAASVLGGDVPPPEDKPTHKVLTKAVDQGNYSICHRGRTCVNKFCLANRNRLHLHLIADMPPVEQVKMLALYEVITLRNAEHAYNHTGCVNPIMDYWHTHEAEFKEKFPKEAEAYFAKTASTQLPSVPPIWTPPTGNGRSSSTSRMTRPNSATRLVGGEIVGSGNRTPSLTIRLDTGANPGSARMRAGSRAGNRRTYGPR